MDVLHVLRLFPTLPYLLIEVMDRCSDYTLDISSLLKKLALKGPCDMWFTIFLRSFRGGWKQAIPLEGIDGKSEDNLTRSENALQSGLVSENDNMELWQLKGRTRDMLMKCACYILKEESTTTLDFFVTSSIQLILASCQSLRMDSIIESFQLVRVMRQRLTSGNESPSQGALLQLFSSIRSILHPQNHPMIVVAAAQAAVELGLWNSVVVE